MVDVKPKGFLVDPSESVLSLISIVNATFFVQAPFKIDIACEPHGRSMLWLHFT